MTRSHIALVAMIALSATLGTWSTRTAVAQDPKTERVQQRRGNEANDAKAEVEIPECLQKLKLSDQQEAQVKTIVADYDRSIRDVWSQFSTRYVQAICMESHLLAAIEDNLTEPQRKQVREERRKTARHEKAIEGSGVRPNQAPVVEGEATEKPANAGEESIASLGVSLTDEQEAAADKVQEAYRAQLRSLTRDIQGLHTRLVSLEADKLVAMEAVLSKEQLAQLRLNRKNAPALTKRVGAAVESR